MIHKHLESTVVTIGIMKKMTDKWQEFKKANDKALSLIF